jgi:hypothetical protein
MRSLYIGGGGAGCRVEENMIAGYEAHRELPGLGEVWSALASGVREQPWTGVGAGFLVGYVLGGGLFTRPTRWLVRAVLGALAVPSVREQVTAPWRRTQPRPGAAAAPF